MALLAYLLLEDNKNTKYLLTNFKCHTQRHHNGLRPDADPMCERIELSIIVPKNDQSFYKWYIEGNSLSGEIRSIMGSYDSKSIRKCRTVSFQYAVCFAFSVDYNANENEQLILTLSIMAKDVHTDIIDANKSDMEDTKTDGTKAKELILVADSGNLKFPIQNFHYTFNRERNCAGFPVGPTQQAVLDFVIKCEYDKNEYFMSRFEQDKFSFYVDGALNYNVNGYIVDIEIVYDRNPNEKIYELTNKINEQIKYLNSKFDSDIKMIKAENLPQYANDYTSMLMRVKVLIADMNFGEKEDLKLIVTE